jgi:hypothetical protein
MNKKTQLAEMMRRKNALTAQLKALKESQSKTGLAFLIEATLEKAEVVMAAKSVVEKLQKMAEDLAKVNGDEIMPIMEPLKSAFGPQMADAFQSMVSEKINATVMAVTQAKDAISSEVAKFEGIIDGSSPGNDMATMGGAAPDPAADLDMSAGDPAAVPAGPAADMSAGGDAPVPGPADALGGEDPLDTSFDAETTSAAGRARKESAAPRGKAIKEGEFVKAKKGENPFAKKDDKDKDDKKDDSKKDENPFAKKDDEVVSESDAKILRAFRTAVREGAKPVPAAKTIARHFGVDYSDVVEIIRESASLGK